MIKFKNITLNSYINYIFVLYAFLLPLSRAAITLLTALLFILWLFTDDFREKINFLKSNKAVIYLVAFVAFSLLSLLWTDNVSSGLYYIRKYWYFLPIFVIATTVEKRFIYHGVSAFLLGMLASEIISYGIFLELWSTRHSSPSDPTPFMSHVQYSMFLAFTSLLILNRLFKETELKWRAIYFLYFLTATSNLFLNGGRTGQLAFILSIFVVGILNIKHRVVAFASMFVLLTAILFTAYNVSPVFKSRVHTSIAESKNILDSNHKGSLGQRISMWTVGTKIFLDNPVAGLGVSCEMNVLNDYIDKYYPDMSNIKHTNSYHSNYIQPLAQLGIIGFILYMMFIYSLITLKIHNREYKNMLIIFVIVYSISSIFETMFHSQFGEALLALFVGIFIAESRQENEARHSR
ncbi:MAG: O-antigen ligase family protein [Sulfurimonas sp.]|nr:O-antigen ligase family protein [Sulfurimonas sp.]